MKILHLPDDISVNPKYKPLLRLATWATERAKIELSAKDDAMISLSEVEMHTNDLNGEEIYLEISLQRKTFDELIADQINDTIDAARETLSKTGYTPNDIERIVWVGDATHYKPLRDKIAFELGIKGDTLDVNPITAIAEGASIFAESIWGVEIDSRIESIEKDMLYRQDGIFKTNVGKDLLHNPFYILKATQQDNRKRIIELAEERSLLSDVDACIEAKSILTIPRKRISAEIAWLPGVPPERAYDILLLLESSARNQINSDKPTSIASINSLADALSRLPYTESSTLADEILGLLNLSEEHLIEEHPIEIDNLMEVSKFLGFDKLSPIARANLLAARMLRLPDYTPDIATKWIIAIVHAFEGINPERVRVILNKERSTSDFPEITELSDIASEIQNLRHYYKQVIKFVLENILSAKERVKAVMMIVDSGIDNDLSHLPILIEDAIDSYEDGAETFLEIEEKKIEKHDQKLRIAAEKEEHEITFARMVGEFIQTVKDWSIIAQPILLKKKRQGLRHEASHHVADRVRQLAIFFFNEYDKLYFSQQILKTLKDVFAAVPEIDERITADLEKLNKIAEQREQKKNEHSLFDNS